MWNDVDIEMIEATQQANAIGAVTTTGPGLSPELVEHFTKQIGSDLFHGYTDSPSYALTCWLEDEGDEGHTGTVRPDLLERSRRMDAP